MGPGIVCKLFPLVLFSFVFFLLVVSSENDVPTTDLQQPLAGNSLSVFAKGSDSAAEGNATEAASKRKRRSKRCKCSKRFTKEVSTMVEERLQEFENKYLLRLNRKEDTMTHDDAAAVAANEAASTLSQKIQNIDHMLLKLNADVLETKEALAFVVGNLDTVKHEFNHTTGNMLALNSSFKKLDKAVANLTRYVEKVQSMIPPGLLCLLPVQV
ncbi:hypothetical protein C0Q70_08230 [Pomacea canaliculata]|uniref:Uncharacterized protein n=1 Tax=Pomacea canaliculata TaxID=400727 RepID=A0A2T7PH87_POMCA|nr:uncharacterized protein LOC112562069 [Pomacea canaliculata]PVD32784.1 hypothetical protein C0Q70_08230 [Pomacea canaliculata]